MTPLARDEGRVAIITAAGRGVGRATGELLAERGYRLALMSPSTSSLELAERLGGLGLQGSVSAPADLERLVAATRERYGRIDALVVSQGHAPWSLESGIAYDPDLESHLLDIPDADWMAGIDLVLMSAIRLCRLVTPAMVEAGGGSIVLVSSFTAFEPRLSFPVSSVLRPALSGFAKLHSDRYGREGVRINCVLPGFIDNWPASETVLRTIPAGRRGMVAEVAATIAFLLSPAAGYITGQSLRVDGGVTRAI